MKVKLKDIKDGDIYINPYTCQRQTAYGSAKLFSNGFVEIVIKGTENVFASNNANMLVEVIYRSSVNTTVEEVESKSLEEQVQYHTELLRLHATTLSVLTGKEVTVETKIKQETLANHLHLGGVDGKVTTGVEDDKEEREYTYGHWKPKALQQTQDKDKSDNRPIKQIEKLVIDFLDKNTGVIPVEFALALMQQYVDSKRPQDVNKEQEKINQLIKTLNMIYGAKGCFILDSRGSLVFDILTNTQTSESTVILPSDKLDSTQLQIDKLQEQIEYLNSVMERAGIFFRAGV